MKPYIYPTDRSKFFFCYYTTDENKENTLMDEFENSKFISYINQVYYRFNSTDNETYSFSLLNKKTSSLFDISLLNKSQNFGKLDQIILNNNSYKKLIDLIKNPPEPNSNLVKLFQEYGECI